MKNNTRVELMKPKKIITYINALLILLTSLLFAQPQPGDVFREYCWFKKDGDAGQALRVGGREGTTNWNTQIVNGYWETVNILLPHDIDLEHAIKAEVNIEKILCHDGTYGLAINLNNSDWINIPEAKNIPSLQWLYQHHIYPTVPVPLSDLKQGKKNVFRMRVNANHSWNWPQNLINGVHIRVYYDQTQKPHPTGQIVSLQNGDNVGLDIELKVDASSPNGDISRVDFIGNYRDVNWEGDGIYRQWHYHFFHGELVHHIGSVENPPLNMTWNTEWVPDQDEPMEIAARMSDETGMITFSESIQDLNLVRDGLSVELCEPYRIPQTWVTRKRDFSEKFQVAGDLQKAKACQFVWASWSPGYMYGIYLNNTKVFHREGPTYQYYAHRINIQEISLLKTGENTLKTGMTPLVGGQMVHGMEVEYPGIMVLIQYDTSTKVGNLGHPKNPEYELAQNYPNPFNPSTTIKYSLQKSSTVHLRVYDILGRRVAVLVTKKQAAGNYTVNWNALDESGNPLPAGVYFYKLQTESFSQVRKMILVR